MANARPRTQGKLDRRLERLGEQIAERLGELTEHERMALTGWRDGIIAGTYDVDHEAIMAQPYESIRRIDRWTEEYDPADYETTQSVSASSSPNAELLKFLRTGLD